MYVRKFMCLTLATCDLKSQVKTMNDPAHLLDRLATL